MTEHTKEPMAWAVMYTDSEYDYRVFAEQEQAEAFALDKACEEHDSLSEVVPLFPLANLPDPAATMAEVREVLNGVVTALKLGHAIKPDSAYADRLAALAAALGGG